jgi:RimJ/RimL family protein N-acetyltransferase
MFAPSTPAALPCCDGPRKTAPQPALADLFGQLADNAWQVPLLARLLPSLAGSAWQLDPADRAAWLVGLNGAWARHGWALDATARAWLLELATAWSAWPLAVAVGSTLRSAGQLPPAGAAQLSEALLNQGDVDDAIELATAMQLADPWNPAHATSYRDLVAWRDWRGGRAPSAGVTPQDEVLRLEPLGHQHAAGFAWQYYDPAIADLCCLPRFADDAGWHCWLDDLYAHGDQWAYAVLHREWGLIGCVSLVLAGDTGFFYYWIGRDWQGQGYGPRAAKLLLDAAIRHAGMRTCYAKVYGHNLASRSALAKSGFTDLQIAAAAPNDNEMFYRFGPPDSRARIVAELHWLLDYLDSDVRAAAPIVAGDA